MNDMYHYCFDDLNDLGIGVLHCVYINDFMGIYSGSSFKLTFLGVLVIAFQSYV
jgi:hypothetical protein